jgi:hypothetical protein
VGPRGAPLSLDQWIPRCDQRSFSAKLALIYLTDGIHLYEVIDEVQNFGRLGGLFLCVQDCLTGRSRQMGQLEQALCRIVRNA